MEQSYTLSICSTEHGEWQGSIARGQDPPAKFQSVLELLKILKTETEKEA